MVMSLKNLPRHISIRQMPRQINRAVLQKFVEKKRTKLNVWQRKKKICEKLINGAVLIRPKGKGGVKANFPKFNKQGGQLFGMEVLNQT